MRANREYRLLHKRGGLLPRRERVDQVEIVEVASGETVLLWDVEPGSARTLLRELRADLAQLEGSAFLARWRDR